MTFLARAQESTVPNSTSFPNIFDESLPQSSSVSPSRICDKIIRSSEKPEGTHIPRLQLDRNDYETAASQRPRRNCKRQAPAAYTIPPPLSKKAKASHNFVTTQLSPRKTPQRSKPRQLKTPDEAAIRESTYSAIPQFQTTPKTTPRIAAKQSARSNSQTKEVETPKRVGYSNTQLETPVSQVKTNRVVRSNTQQKTREDLPSSQEVPKALPEATSTQITYSDVQLGSQSRATFTEQVDHGQRTFITTEKSSNTASLKLVPNSISAGITNLPKPLSQQEQWYDCGTVRSSPLPLQASQLDPLLGCDLPLSNESLGSNFGSQSQYLYEQCAQPLSSFTPASSQSENFPSSSQTAADLNISHKGEPSSPRSQEEIFNYSYGLPSQEHTDKAISTRESRQNISSQDHAQAVHDATDGSDRNEAKTFVDFPSHPLHKVGAIMAQPAINTLQHAAIDYMSNRTAGSPLSPNSHEKFRRSPWISPQSSPTSFASPVSDPALRYVSIPLDNDKANTIVPSHDSYQTQPTQPLTRPVFFHNSETSEDVPPSPEVSHPTIDEPDDISSVDSQATTLDEDEATMLATALNPEIKQQELYYISEKLFAHRKSGLSRPEPIGRPEVWADGRQELCETLHYFRSYQSACYSTGGFVRAFMFDKVAHPRDYFDSNVVIARAGGGLVKDKDSGEMKAGRDQIEDTVVKGLRNCMNHYNPVVIITGIDNPYIPSQPPHQYCVLDYFKPTHIWAEKSGKSKILRYRFEKLNTRKESWWRAKDVQDPIELGSLPPPFSKICEVCNVASQQIYLNGWMCLQPACTMFWNITTSNDNSTPYEPVEAHLTYDPRFLKQQSSWPNDNHDYPLTSNHAELSGHSIPGEDTSQAFWFGMVCPLCGRCNSRLAWTGWECLNPTCTFTKRPPHTLISALSLREPLWPLTSSYTLSRDVHLPSIKTRVTFAYGYRIIRYMIPGINGFITHMIANKSINEEAGGPDTMFEDLQNEDIGLRRRAMSNSQLKGESYCRHFAVNYGMPYKFIAATASHPFSSAARPITATRSRLNWAAKYLFTQEDNSTMESVSKQWAATEFNEVLALGYFEAQKINYHDDGEFGLGPTIATLSLGAPGTMRIRMKARHYNGVSAGAGVYDDTPPLPTCSQYEARLALQPSLSALKEKDIKAYRARLKQIPKELKLKSGGNAKDVLKMELGHGDVVVMHGAALQKYYEHAVEHQGKLRFALTCRFIDPESLAEEERPRYEVGRDEGGYDGGRVG